MADEQEQSKAAEQADRHFEVVKLRIAFLQHLTTLSGAAILIVLALAERAETTGQVILLLSTLTSFFVAALISITGVVFLLMLLTNTERVLGSNRATAGTFATYFAGLTFLVGMAAVAAFSAAGGTRRMIEDDIDLVYLVGALLLAFVVALIVQGIILLRLMRWINDPYAPVRDANEDDELP